MFVGEKLLRHSGRCKLEIIMPPEQEVEFMRTLEEVYIRHPFSTESEVAAAGIREDHEGSRKHRCGEGKIRV